MNEGNIIVDHSSAGRSTHRFENKVVFITGGGSGIGATAVKRFAEEGATVIAADIAFENALAVAAAVSGADAISLDVSDPSAVDIAFKVALETHGRVDVVFNNAAIDVPVLALHETPVDVWREIQSVNSDGFFYVLKFGIQALLANGGGAVVNNASTAGLRGYSGKVPYSFAKGGVISATRAAAVEYSKQNIRVNAVAPGSTQTPLWEHLASTGSTGRTPGRTPMDGINTTDNVLDAVLFLASDEAARTTGHILPVDGGLTTY